MLSEVSEPTMLRSWTIAIRSPKGIAGVLRFTDTLSYSIDQTDYETATKKAPSVAEPHADNDITLMNHFQIRKQCP